jgi:hypothetical protein
VNLGAVGRVGEATGAEAVAKRERHIVGLGDLQQAVEVFEKWVLHVVVCHPLDGEGAAARHHVHDPAFAPHPFHAGARHTAVYSDEVDAVLGVFQHSVEDVIDGHLDNCLVLVPDCIKRRLVERHGADCGGGFGDDGASDLVDRAAGGKIHDSIGAAGYGHARFFQFFLNIKVVGGAADVGVHLGPKPLPYRQRRAI